MHRISQYKLNELKRNLKHGQLKPIQQSLNNQEEVKVNSD
jgi:hypothetical protein